MSTFLELDEKLQGRCKDSRKVGNHTYLHRRGKDAIAVKLHATDVLTFHRTGQIDLCNGGYPTITTHDRMNNYLPAGYRVSGEPMETRRTGAGMSVLCRFEGKDVAFHYERVTKQECLIDNRATILPDGSLQGADPAEYRKERREARNEANRERNRERRWVAKARGIFVDTSNCAARKANKRWECDTQGRFNRRNNGLQPGEQEKTMACGCVQYREVARPGNLTVDSIMAETNAAVRAAQMSIYGTERFFLDAKPDVLDTLGEYSLVSIDFGSWQHVRALKMRCPSTDAVYIQTVPPNVMDVAGALDWIFDTTDYLAQVTAQS